MKCKQCKQELKVNLKTSSLIGGILVVVCHSCGNDNFDTDITNKVTQENLYWNKKKIKSGRI